METWLETDLVDRFRTNLWSAEEEEEEEEDQLLWTESNFSLLNRQ